MTTAKKKGFYWVIALKSLFSGEVELLVGNKNLMRRKSIGRRTFPSEGDE